MTFTDLTTAPEQWGTIIDKIPASCRTPTGGTSGSEGTNPHPATNATEARGPSARVSTLLKLAATISKTGLTFESVHVWVESGAEVPHGKGNVHPVCALPATLAVVPAHARHAFPLNRVVTKFIGTTPT
jgi:hypothetical protein